MWKPPSKGNETLNFNIGNTTICVTRYGYKRVDVSKYVCKIISQKNSYDLITYTEGAIIFHNLEDAKKYILRIKQDYKNYQEMIKKMSISSDFV